MWKKSPALTWKRQPEKRAGILLGIQSLTGLRLLNRYDVEGIDEALFQQCVPHRVREPQVDVTYAELPASDGAVFAVEYLPGQFDQRADSASECIQLISQGERPTCAPPRSTCWKAISTADVMRIKQATSSTRWRPARLRLQPGDPEDGVPRAQPVWRCWTASPSSTNRAGGVRRRARPGHGLRRHRVLPEVFPRAEQRDPTITEIRWSTPTGPITAATPPSAPSLDDVQIDDAVVQAAFDRYLAMRDELGREGKRPVPHGHGHHRRKYLKKRASEELDESEEINACTVKITCDVNGEDEDWLLLFKNETHNHPTEIEPFGGAATCIGGASATRCPGRSYVYQAMRVTGAADPLVPGQRDAAGQAAAAQARDHRGGGLFLLRQPDRSCHRPGR